MITVTRSVFRFPSSTERYHVLLELSRSLTSASLPGQFFAAVHAHVVRALPTTSFTALVLDEAGELRVTFRAGSPEKEVAPLEPEEMQHLEEGDFLVRETDAETELLAPLIAEDALLGVLVAGRAAERPFDASDANFLLAVGGLAGVAMDNLRLFRESRRRQEEAELLEAAARDLNASLAPDEVVARVAARAHALTGHPVEVWVVEGEQARAVAEAGGAAVPLGMVRRLPAEDRDLGIRAHFTAPGQTAVPLVTGGELVGLLVAGSHGGRPLDRRQVNLLERLAPHAASAVENARLHDAVRRLSLTDPLTSLPNRRQLDLILEKEFAAAQRGRPLCFALFDLDGFKGFNDTYGHQAGDDALVRFARILETETRAMNLVARYGGEEFAAVLSDISRAGALGYADRVRTRLEREMEGLLTVSAGIAVYKEDMASPAELIEAADRALYRAKRSGRNRACVAETP